MGVRIVPNQGATNCRVPADTSTGRSKGLPVSSPPRVASDVDCGGALAFCTPVDCVEPAACVLLVSSRGAGEIPVEGVEDVEGGSVSGTSVSVADLATVVSVNGGRAVRVTMFCEEVVTGTDVVDID